MSIRQPSVSLRARARYGRICAGREESSRKRSEPPLATFHSGSPAIRPPRPSPGAGSSRNHRQAARHSAGSAQWSQATVSECRPSVFALLCTGDRQRLRSTQVARSRPGAHEPLVASSPRSDASAHLWAKPTVQLCAGYPFADAEAIARHGRNLDAAGTTFLGWSFGPRFGLTGGGATVCAGAKVTQEATILIATEAQASPGWEAGRQAGRTRLPPPCGLHELGFCLTGGRTTGCSPHGVGLAVSRARAGRV